MTSNELTTTLQQQETKQTKSRLENLLEAIKNSKSEYEQISNLILYNQEKDYQEYKEGKEKKSFYLSNFIKDEFIIRSANAGCKKASIKLTPQAVRAIVGLGFLVEDHSLEFSFKPLDKTTYLVTFKINSENMSNGQIFHYNDTYNLEIPMNEAKEIIPDEERYNNNFTQFSVQKIVL